MPYPNTTEPDDELTPELKRALVEIGAIIPTTTEEVELAEAQYTSEPSSAKVNAAFEKVLFLLAEEAPAEGFIQLPTVTASTTGCELAMAARNGGELDADTLAKIEQDVARATQNPS